MTFKLYKTTQELPQNDWQALCLQQYFYLQIPYLATLEKTLPPNLQPYYLIAYTEKLPIFIAYLQLYSFEKTALENLKTTGFLSTGLGKMLMKRFYAQSYKVLILGNTLVTSSNSYACLPQTPDAQQMACVEEALAFCKENIEFDASVLKDAPAQFAPIAEYQPLLTEPNMVLELPKNWRKKEDYSLALSAKYRTRYKSAQKKAANVLVKPLSLVEVKRYEAELFGLFEQVYDKVAFKIAKIKPAYFTEFKTDFEDSFFVNGYFLDEKLIGFTSSFRHENGLDAHFIGIDYAHNATKKLYQNMLYNFVHEAIELGANRLNLSRTALAIKSTVGAEPEVLNCSINFCNCMVGTIFSPVIKRLKTTEWQQRNPFKDGEPADFSLELA